MSLYWPITFLYGLYVYAFTTAYKLNKHWTALGGPALYLNHGFTTVPLWTVASQIVETEQIDDTLLTCAICLEHYKNPKLLPCQHSYCEQCLVTWMEQHGGLDCPNCRCSHSIESVEQLPPSTMITSVVEILKEQQHGDTCHGCQGNVSTHNCADCVMNFCNACINVHNKMPLTQHHGVMEIADIEKVNEKNVLAFTSEVYCTLHKDKLVELYCNACKATICHICLRSEHRRHDVIDLQSAADVFKALASNHIDILRERVQAAEKSNTDLLVHSKELADQRAQQESQLKTHTEATIEQVTGLIKQQESDLLAELCSRFDSIDADINEKMSINDSTKQQLSSTIMFSENMLKYCNAAQLMKSSKQTTDQLEAMATLDVKGNIRHNTLPDIAHGTIVLTGVLGKLPQINNAFLSDVKEPLIPIIDGDGDQAALPGDCNGKTNTEDDNDEVIQDKMSANRAKSPPGIVVQQLKGSTSHSIDLNVKMELERELGVHGSTIGSFKKPIGLAIDTNGYIVVADHGNHRVQVIDLYGRPKRQVQFTGYSKTVYPIDIAVSLQNRYFITDGSDETSVGNNQVIVCDQFGKVIQCFGEELKNPWGIAINHNNGIVYVVDRGAHCIRLYHLYDFKYDMSFGRKGDGSCKFNDPTFITINSKGNVIVSNTGCKNIMIFSFDGVFLFRLMGSHIKGSCSLIANGVTVDQLDNIYICENSRIVVYNSEGKFVDEIVGILAKLRIC
ncbi:E3 ubiquitin-protein ligase TRIM32-like [Saccoglossus kowalevskii]